MIYQTYQTIQEFNQTGIDNVLLYVALVEPSFVPLFLFCFFLLITLGTYFGTKRFSGSADFFASCGVGGLITTIVAVMMTLKEGLINGYTLVTCFAITILFIILLFFSRER